MDAEIRERVAQRREFWRNEIKAEESRRELDLMGKEEKIQKLAREKAEAQKLLTTLFYGLGESHEKDLMLWLQIKKYMYDNKLAEPPKPGAGKNKFS